MRTRHTTTVRRSQLSFAKLRPIVLRVAREYGVSNVRIFGSFARGDQRKTSDVDLLVDLPDGMSLLDLSGLKIDLEEALRRRVDVVPARAIKTALRDSILSEARPL
ncbi:nucleotidyltransferase family protein [Candidatus Peregrinibacteria bacterium]|nr:nucleotidyltransferase family protein [Candidatus Peregrinibacteria bacterium]MBI3816268.1 nucleotidyltransferase family protein [Candidatus Peregrinibacteria bacterium]